MDQRNGYSGLGHDSYTPPRALLGPDGLPITSARFGKDGFPLPHVLQMGAIIQSGFEVYWGRWDEARRHSKENALAMEKDCFLQSLLQERALATSTLKWHVHCDDEKDPYQKALKDGMQRVLNCTPHKTRMHFETLKGGMWYGRSANQRIYEWKEISVPVVKAMPVIPGGLPAVGGGASPPPSAEGDGSPPGITRHLASPGDKLGAMLQTGGAPAAVVTADERRRCLVVKRHQPVHGDSIYHKFDGTPVIMTYTPEAESLSGAQTTYTTEGSKAVVLSGTWRERFVVYSHESKPAEFFDYEKAEAIHGAGLRDVAYWSWWMKTEYLEWFTTFFERFGLGLRLWYYEAGNPNSQKEVYKLAVENSRRVNILVPVYGGKTGKAYEGGMESIETPVQGTQVITEMMRYFDQQMERYFVGQSMSGGADNESGLGGTGRAKFAANTKYQLVKYDAENLADCYTSDWVRPVQRWTYPEAKDVPLEFKFNVPDPENGEKLEAVEKAISFGVEFKTEEVRGLTGMSDPQPGDDVVGGKAQLAAQMAADAAASQPLGDDQGDDKEAVLDPFDELSETERHLIERHGRYDPTQPRDDKGRWVDVVGALVAAHPEPPEEPSEFRTPGLSNPKMLAADPRLAEIAKRRSEHTAAFQRYRIAQVMHRLLTEGHQLIRMPREGEDVKRAKTLGRLAVDERAAAEADEDIFDTAFRKHHEQVLAAHPEAPAAFEAARAEATRRREAATARVEEIRRVVKGNPPQMERHAPHQGLIDFHTKDDDAPLDLVLYEAVRSILPIEKPAAFPHRCGEVGGIAVCLVDGDKVKLENDMDFVEGANDLELLERADGTTFVPPKEVWIDGLLRPQDWPFVGYHELHERRDMAGGMKYDAAHERANAGEKALRQEAKASAASDLKDRNVMDAKGNLHKPAGTPEGGQFARSLEGVDPADLKRPILGFRIQGSGEDMPEESADMWGDDPEATMGGVSSFANLSNAIDDLLFGARESVTGANYSGFVRSDGNEPEIWLLTNDSGKTIDAPGAETVIPKARPAGKFTKEQVEAVYKAVLVAAGKISPEDAAKYGMKDIRRSLGLHTSDYDAAILAALRKGLMGE